MKEEKDNIYIKNIYQPFKEVYPSKKNSIWTTYWFSAMTYNLLGIELLVLFPVGLIQIQMKGLGIPLPPPWMKCAQ